MVSFKATLLALAGAATVSADYWINTTAVPLSLRIVWCRDQTAACPLICQSISPGPVIDNSCTPETLQYGCLCANQMRPNLSEYSMTIPFHTCQEYGNKCVEECGPWNNQCANDCREDHPCGAQNPQKVNSTSTGTLAPTATPSKDPNQVFDGLAGEPTDPANANGNSNNSGAGALHFGQTYGLAVVLTSLFAGFAIML
ncbi:hypothetical protein QBC37DRAFT_3758 [Rhypophila decipiens]|uniref:DUF7707 domain-containing protein n=1 Tax=Rhypophila decipiens TaxID=261697 RepID=A0AAN6YJG8_9PEZI|nr:hypothetical protein QBC37DRAFT_3758 [Rhypophila decipiens]